MLLFLEASIQGCSVVKKDLVRLENFGQGKHNVLILDLQDAGTQGADEGNVYVYMGGIIDAVFINMSNRSASLRTGLNL